MHLSGYGSLNNLISCCSCAVPLTPCRQIAEAQTALLKAYPAATEVRDIKVRIKTLRRRARILYLPAYVVDYNFGLSFNSHGERRPKACQAIISGMGESCLLLSDKGSRLPKGPAGGAGYLGQWHCAVGRMLSRVFCPQEIARWLGLILVSVLPACQLSCNIMLKASTWWRLLADAVALSHLCKHFTILSWSQQLRVCPLWSAGDAAIAAERHFDPRKAQFAAAATVGGATALASSIVAPWLGLTAHSLFSVEAAFRAFIVASCAGGLAGTGPS